MDHKTVLILDDDAQMRDTLEDILDEEGYEPLSAPTCREAHRLANEKKPQVCLIDLKLPDGSGISFLNELRSLNEDSLGIMITGHADLDTAIAAMEQGAFQYLQKPVKPAVLLHTLNRAFENIRLKEQKRLAERRYLESERMVRSLVDAFPSGALLVDREGVVLAANRPVSSLIGLPIEEIEGAPLERLHSQVGLSFGKVKFPEVLASGTPSRFEESFKDRFYQTSVAPIFDEQHHVIRLAVFSQDVTELKNSEDERKKLEQHLLHSQKMEAIGTLAGGISHDFNNFLQAIMGYSQILLLDKGEDHPDLPMLREIEKAAQRASELTQQLLTFSRRLESRLRPINLNQEVMQVERLLRRTIPKMIDISLELARDLKIIEADSTQIEQVLMNLAVNARDAMRDGGKLRIETCNIHLDENFCRLYPSAIPGDYARLSITDTGHGMAKEILDHIFEPFYTTKEVGKGTGLGLSMVYGIVKSHHGIIQVNSEPGKGATFNLYFPVLLKQPPASEETASPGALPRGHETLLLVDDEESLRNLAGRVLSRYGYRILYAENAEQALALYRQEVANISLILLDLIMPGMGGVRCIEELLKINPSAKVVIASGYLVDEEVKRNLEHRAKGYITKPFEVSSLLTGVRAALDKK